MKLVLYFTLGYPSSHSLMEFLETIPPGAVEYIELGFPSTDPKYDGPTIRRTHRHALQGFSEQSVSETVKCARGVCRKVYALRYYSDIEKDEGFLERITNIGFDGIIIPDVLTDYFHDRSGIINRVREAGLEFIPFVNPSTPDIVLGEIMSTTDSWIYYGLLPSTGIMVPYDLSSVRYRLRNAFPGRRIVLGFGIRSPDEAARVSSTGQFGIAIGTMLIEHLDSGSSREFVTSILRLKEAISSV
ncbi:MAG: tryptophan synthase subunit alpha [Candidatus Thermoplasmatota archaeon]|nr:tryptophan synthase subunit alpha [Candidatus Thermoplasmatota archaeon]